LRRTREKGKKEKGEKEKGEGRKPIVHTVIVWSGKLT